jgi:hypothetical protein
MLLMLMMTVTSGGEESVAMTQRYTQTHSTHHKDTARVVVHLEHLSSIYLARKPANKQALQAREVGEQRIAVAHKYAVHNYSPCVLYISLRAYGCTQNDEAVHCGGS